MNKIWFPQLLRGVAASFVLVAHLFVVPLPYMGELLGDSFLLQPSLNSANILQRLYFFLADNILNLGAFGVGIFFLISGFVISFSIEKRSSLHFLLNRLFRVYPVVVVVLIADLLIIFLYHIIKCFLTHTSPVLGLDFFFTPPHSLLNFVINGTLILRPIGGSFHVDGVLWTLEIEMLFYLLMCLVGKKVISNYKYLLGTALFLSMVFWLLFYRPELRDIPYLSFLFNSIPHLLLMFVGIVSYCFFKEKWEKKLIFKTLLFLLFLLIPCYLALYKSNFILTLSYCILPMITWAVFFVLDNNKVLTFNPYFNFLANISFSLYLTHQLLGFSLLSLLFVYLRCNIYLSIFLSILTCLIWSVFIYYFVEKKAQNWSRKF